MPGSYSAGRQGSPGDVFLFVFTIKFPDCIFPFSFCQSLADLCQNQGFDLQLIHKLFLFLYQTQCIDGKLKILNYEISTMVHESPSLAGNDLGSGGDPLACSWRSLDHHRPPGLCYRNYKLLSCCQQLLPACNHVVPYHSSQRARKVIIPVQRSVTGLPDIF